MRNSLIGAFIRLVRFFLKVDHDKVVILPCTNPGSLGDQAMIDSACRHIVHTLRMKTVLIARKTDTLDVHDVTEVAVFDAPGIWKKVVAARQIFLSGQMLMIGADVIDGRYGGDCARLGLLDLAARSGLKCAISGFSFSEKPGSAALERLKNLPTMPLHARDAVSLKRFEDAVQVPATLVADLAFLVTPSAEAENSRIAISWAQAQRDMGRTVLGVNTGGTTLSKMKGDGLDSIGECLEGWLDANPDRAVLLLPHDYKPQPVGDVEPLQALLDRLTPQFGDRVHMVQFPFETWDVKAMAEVMDFTLLARMHFAIACLGMGVPPLCIAYAGKFEGLMQHFGLENMLVSNEEVLDPAALLARLETFESAVPVMKEKISAALPAVKDLSKRNFAWL